MFSFISGVSINLQELDRNVLAALLRDVSQEMRRRLDEDESALIQRSNDWYEIRKELDEDESALIRRSNDWYEIRKENTGMFRNLYQNSGKIPAIKKMRALTGMSLRDAKDAIERMACEYQWGEPHW